MPFTTQQFFQIFTDYNLAVFPIQFVLPLLAVVAVASACRYEGSKDRIAPAMLGIFWIWSGAVYHILFFSRINSAAWLFGTLFVIQGLLFARAAFRKELDLSFSPDIRGWAGASMIGYALVFYPLIEILDGKSFIASPTFGTPCPLTIFTFGLLTWSRSFVPWYLLVIPAVWSVIGTIAAFSFGVAADLALPVAGMIGVAFAITVDMRSTRRII
jgi:hypothetical protein